MKRHLLLLGMLSMFTACQPEAEPVTLDFERGQIRLAMTNPTLVSEAGAYLAAMYFIPAGAGCAQLFEMSLPELAAMRAELTQPAVSLASSQAWPANPTGDESASHTFGKIEAWGDYAFLVMASRLVKSSSGGDFVDADSTPGGELSVAEGSVFAMGCTEERVEPGKRLDLKLTLFPSGIR